MSNGVLGTFCRRLGNATAILRVHVGDCTRSDLTTGRGELNYSPGSPHSSKGSANAGLQAVTPHFRGFWLPFVHTKAFSSCRRTLLSRVKGLEGDSPSHHGEFNDIARLDYGDDDICCLDNDFHAAVAMQSRVSYHAIVSGLSDMAQRACSRQR